MTAGTELDHSHWSKSINSFNVIIVADLYQINQLTK